MTDKYFYVTTPIYYVTGNPHLGSAYTNIACDVMARFKRLDGYKVKFLTGTDEHGLKVFQSAQDNGVSTLEYCDQVSKKFRDILPVLNLSNDDFIRTTEPRHKTAAQALWKKLADKGDIYLGKYEGWYAVKDEAYYDEAETHLNDKGARIATASGQPVEWMVEETYFFKLSAYQDKLVDYFTRNPDAIGPKSRHNEIMSFIKSGLRDLSVSRTNFDWGIPVPGDEKHVMYVWIDALTNYLSALGYPDETPEMKNFWPEVIHFVGKDIQRFHCVYWPAFLMSADILPPKRVYAHGWWTAEGKKMSKSFGNVIDPVALKAQYGLDQLRYFLMREVPFGADGDFSHERFQIRMNSDLANNLGNLAQRVLSFVYKNCEGKIPEYKNPKDVDDKLVAHARGLIDGVRPYMDAQQFDKVLEHIWSVVTEANIYVDEQAPWALKKTDTERMGTVLYALIETIRCVGILIQPFMPESADKLLDQLAVPADKRNFDSLSAAAAIKSGTAIPEPQGVFPRFVAQAA